MLGEENMILESCKRRYFMSKEKFMCQCFICGGDFQFGPHRYEGRKIPRYNINVCNNCYEANWDGWAPHYEKKLVAHLRKEDLPIPERNAEGWLPRD
jgi:hypothetical protein